ncbi:MAG: S9 family peptidase [Thermoanaerobaculia bacterium]
MPHRRLCCWLLIALPGVFVTVADSIASPDPAPNDAPEARAVPTPPRAAVRPHVFHEHGNERVDEYYWLRDDSRKNPEVLAYLEAENAYTDAVLAPTRDLRRKLFEEMAGRVRQDDDSVPFRRDGYWYYRRFEAGSDYDRLYRRRGTLEAPEELLLDLNQRAAGHSYYHLGEWDVTRDGRVLAFSEDTVSRRQYTIRFRDLATGSLLPDEIVNVDGSNFCWAADHRTLFYLEKDPVTLLAYRVRRHRLGTPSDRDPIVWEEEDHSFYTGISRTKSGRFLVITSHSTVSTEQRLLESDRPEGEFRLFLQRERDHEYWIEDLGDRFVVRTNWQAPNFRLMSAPAATTSDRSTWRNLVGTRDDIFLDDFEAFPGYLAIAERSVGLKRVRIHPLDGSGDRYIESDEPDYVAALTFQSEQETTTVRYRFTSLRTPATVYELDMATGARRVLKVDEVPGGFSSSDYRTERLFLPARDGVEVPVSLLYRRGTALDGTAPLVIKAYGSYGISSDPYFDSAVLSLVDRGFVYAIAHVRGGQEMGRRWYDDGKLLHKKNTFRDFIDVTEGLVARRIGARDRVFALGGSAGGLLMGAIATMRPDLYRGVFAAVPFVDVVTTMLDETIPLTSNEFDEWGDPRIREYYDYMLSYSPYDQVRPQAYPNLLVTTGLWDSQVQYFEPAKWVARLRARKTDPNLLLLRTNMEAGHGGKSGRFARLEDTALQYAFLLYLAGIDH